MLTATYHAGLVALTALAMLSSSSAHLILKSPVPFGTDSLNNSPLVDAAIGSSGSDFPCKQRPGVYKISSMNDMKVGDSQTLSFTGTASHGGGTCQLAVSLDHEPTANSTWKLIQVYEGGCPVTAAGNGGTDTFTYKIPDKFPNGQATLAWTWYNRVGNREIYMNCAPITVSGGADNNDFYNTLPDMYIINLPTSQCSSVESSNQLVPNPGQFVLSGDTSDKVASATGPACGAAAAAQTNGVSGHQSAAASNGAATTSGGSSAAPNANGGGQAPAAPAPTVAPSSMLTVASSAPVSLTVAPAPSAPPAPGSGNLDSDASPSAPAPANSGSSSSPPTSGSNSTGAASGSGTCTQNGAVVCNGPSQFGLCNNGQVVWQAVAAGTTCADGKVQKRSLLAGNPHVRRQPVELY